MTTLELVGLGYTKFGQQATTLSDFGDTYFGDSAGLHSTMPARHFGENCDPFSSKRLTLRS